MRSVLFAVLLVALAGCGQNPREKALELLNEGKRDEAIQTLEKAIAEGVDEESAPSINGMVAELLTTKCVTIDCAQKDPATLQKIRKYLSAVKGPVKLPDGTSYDVYEKVLRNATRLISQKQSPESYNAFVANALPDSAPKARLVGMLMDEAYAELAARRADSAGMILEAIKNTAEADSPIAKTASYYQSILNNDLPAAVAAAPAVFENISPPDLERAMKAITFLYMTAVTKSEAENAGDVYFTTMLSFFKSFGLEAQESDENSKLLSHILDDMSNDETVIARLSEKITPVQGFKNHQIYVKTRLIKLAIVYDAADPNRWKSFFGPALDNIALDQPLTFMYDNVDLSKMPSQVIIDNNIVMLRRLKDMLDEGYDIVPVLKEIIYRSDADQLNFTEQTNHLLEQAVAKAVGTKNVDALVNYASYEPNVVANSVDKVAGLVIESIQESWNTNDFERIERLADFLSNTLKINFSLEVKLSELFSDYLASPEVADKIASYTPRDLLRSFEEARIDLNPKLDYIKQKFATRPEIVQSRLRAAAVNAAGPYGTANALLSMYDELDKADRDKHLTTAIKLGISNDKSITAPELAEVGSKLAERWKPEITYNFIINESLTRLKDLDDARKVWKAGSEKFRESAEKLRPQIASLMRGIDAYDRGDLQEAAKRFMVITDQSYLRAAEPYLKEFREAVNKHVGTYGYSRIDDNLHIVTIEISPSSDLLKANVTLTSAVGMVEVSENFITDKGRTYKMRLSADVNPETLELTIPLDQLLSQVEDMPVGRAFGRIKSIQMDNGELVVKAEGDGKPYIFKQIADKVGAPIRPNGRFGITKQLSPSDANSDHVLPVGSILNITTSGSIIQRNVEMADGTSAVLSVYPVTGTILHPSTPEPIELEGYYNPDKNTTELTYAYPMNDGRTVLDAVVRCNIIENHLICGAHNRHWSRQRYTHVVEGLQAK
ncbi:MAG: hypothetical protein GC134_04460 [Proteobacteria bacterium]|nr:hypothetical protein [Pseudomonadota bacterium]